MAIFTLILQNYQYNLHIININYDIFIISLDFTTIFQS